MRRSVTRALWRLSVGMSVRSGGDSLRIYRSLKEWWCSLPHKERSLKKLQSRGEEWVGGAFD